MDQPPFVFLDPGPLRDGELELIEPSPAWIDAAVEACHHPLTAQRFPSEAKLTRHDIEQFVESHPRGRQAGDPSKGIVPAYHFWMLLRPECNPPLRIAGGVGLRLGRTMHVMMYGGHIGYHVYPVVRGHHYAERACRLLYPLALRHGYRELWITTNPDNIASRRTCERLGARFIEIVDIPSDDPLYARGERQKCRYRLGIGNGQVE